MATQKTKFTLGLFVTCGIGIALLAVIWLGMSRYLEKGQYYATYFDESVQGLTIDSPVKYRGVSIGRVDRIMVAPDADLIQVVLKIESGQMLDNNIVAQLKSVGITGSMFVELDHMKDGASDKSPFLTFPSEYPIVASKPSNISELWQGIDDVLNEIRSLDLKGISERMKWTLDSANQVMVDADVNGISQRLKRSLDSAGFILDHERWSRIMASLEESGLALKDLINKANKSLSPVETALSQVEGITMKKSQDIISAIEDFQQATHNANILFQKGILLANHTDYSLSRISRDLVFLIQNLGEASENLNRLMEVIADHPSQLLFSEPPFPKDVEADMGNP